MRVHSCSLAGKGDGYRRADVFKIWKCSGDMSVFNSERSVRKGDSDN